MLRICAAQPPPFLQEGFGAASGGDVFEAGLGDAEEGSGGRGSKGELDEGRSFVGVVYGGIDGVGMPGEGEGMFGLDLLDGGFPADVFVAGMGDVTGGGLAGLEGCVEFDAKPFAELGVVGEGLPDAGDGGVDFDGFVDDVGFHGQPLGCILAHAKQESATDRLHENFISA